MAEAQVEVLTAQNARLREALEKAKCRCSFALKLQCENCGAPLTAGVEQFEDSWICGPCNEIQLSDKDLYQQCDRCAALAETPVQSLEAVRAEAATSGARNLAAAFHRAVKAAAPDITYPESDEPLESAVAYIFTQIRAESKSEARKELAEITAKLFPELREAIRSAVWSETETIQGAMSKALESIREKAGRERAVRELAELANKCRHVAHLPNMGHEAVIPTRFLRERLEEIAKEGK